MSFAEIILRIGTSIAAWLIFIGLGLTLSVIPQATCDPGSDELWRGTLFFALLSALALLFVGRGLPWRHSLRWLTIPGIGLAIYAGLEVFPAVGLTLVEGGSLCGIANSSLSPDQLSRIEASTLERVWPVMQLLVLLGGVVQGVRYWVGPRDAKEATSIVP